MRYFIPGVTDPLVLVKVAVTYLVFDMATQQFVFVPPHAPLQPENVDPAAGVAVNLTTVPAE